MILEAKGVRSDTCSSVMVVYSWSSDQSEYRTGQTTFTYGKKLRDKICLNGLG